MARNRTIYSNEILMVAPSATGSQDLNYGGPGESLIRQLKRVQNVNYAFSINRTDTYQFGQLSRIDSAVLSAPAVSLDFSYYLTDGQNENLLGFDNAENSNFLAEDFINDQDGRNFYIYTADQKNDAIGSIVNLESQDDSGKSVTAIGNCYVTNYSVNAAVGGLPVASVSAEAFNIKVDAGNKGGTSPGINIKEGTKSTNQYVIPNEYISTGEGVAQLLPGDIEVDFGTGSLLSLVADSDTRNSSHIQSVSIDIPLGRTTLQRVGNSFGYSKVLNTPITASVSISAILADRPNEHRSLFEEVYSNNSNDIKITMRKPSSAGAKQGDKSIIYTLKNATLASESYGMSIGDNRSADYTFTAQLGDPATVADGSLGGAFTMNSSGIYEQLQVFETGVSTDTSNHFKDNIGYGHAIAANNDILVIGASGFRNSNFELGAAYIYKKEKGFYKQVQLTSGQNHAAGLSNASFFTFDEDDMDVNVGFDVAVSPQNLIALGAMNSDFGSSAVAILHPNDTLTNWTVNDIVTGAADALDTINLGRSIAFDKEVSGTTQWFAAGAPLHSPSGELGMVQVRYGTKGEVNSFAGYELPKSNTELPGSAVHDVNERFGTSVAIHNGRIVVGAPGYSDQSGVAYVYAADGTGPHTSSASWVEVAQLTGLEAEIGDATPAFGQSVDIYSNTIVVGAPSGLVNNQGCAVVFTTDQTYRGWSFAATLSASDAANGDLFGHAVSMPNSSTIVVSSPKDNYDSVNNGGSVYVFTGAGINWTETQKIKYTGSISQDEFGRFNTSLATTQKDIFVGGEPLAAATEKVIRYRI